VVGHLERLAHVALARLCCAGAFVLVLLARGEWFRQGSVGWAHFNAHCTERSLSLGLGVIVAKPLAPKVVLLVDDT
jgi:hypothetical protein